MSRCFKTPPTILACCFAAGDWYGIESVVIFTKSRTLFLIFLLHPPCGADVGFVFLDILSSVNGGDSYDPLHGFAPCVWVSVGSCFTALPCCTSAPQANTRCPRAKMFFAALTSALS